jgi:hypothetical protein
MAKATRVAKLPSMMVLYPCFVFLLRKDFVTGNGYLIQLTVNFAVIVFSFGLAGEDRMIDFG